MKLSTNHIIYLILLVIIASLLLTRGCNNGPTPEPEIRYEYLTKFDTVYEKYEVPVPYEVRTPPKIKIIYADTVKVPVEVEVIPDSLIVMIEGYKQVISQQFLAKHPDNPKLISLGLDRDTLDLTLMTPHGLEFTDKYPIYLNEFKYRWVDNKLTHTENKLKRKPKLDLLGLYANVNYDILGNNFLVGSSYEVDIWRFKLGIQANVSIEQQPNLYLWAGAHYRLLKPNGK